MRIKVKVCGLSSSEAVDAAVQGGASHVGFVIARHPKPGEVSVEQAVLLAARIPPQVGRVAVAHEPDSLEFAAAVARVKVQVFQFFAPHPPQGFWGPTGGPTYGRAVWAVAPIRTEGNLRALEAWRGRFDRIVYDLGDGVGAGASSLARRDHPAPWALRGDITAANVGELVAASRATMLDVASGIRNGAGVADPDRIAEFLDAVRACEPPLRRKPEFHAVRPILPQPLPARIH